MAKYFNPYHLVSPSPWPIYLAASVFTTAFGLVIFFHHGIVHLLFLGLFLWALIMVFWLKDVVREATFQGAHTTRVIAAFKFGFMIFIFSEAMLFVSFFWAFFHSSLSPGVDIGVTWPPLGVIAISPWGLPLVNTAILLSSGCTITWSHHSLVANKKKESILALILTCFLGFIFTLIQLYEYKKAPFTVADSVYGSCFFILTGFHGLHVLVGTTFLLVCLNRLTLGHFLPSRHVGYECAIWYWHFVDVIWIFVWFLVYWWGS